MGRSHQARPGLGRFAILLGLAFVAWPLKGHGAESSLKLLISVEQTRITSPFPARVSLQIHNAGQEALWLYRRARDPGSVRTAPPLSDRPTSETTGGATVGVNLEPVAAPTPQDVIETARGRIIESVGLAKPRLARLGPGEDYDEKVSLQLSPTIIESDGQKKPFWGRYRLSVVYGARYSNAEEIQRNLHATLWQGEAASNVVEIELAPPPADAQCSISGRVMRAEGRAVFPARVSLVDDQDHVLEQIQADESGRYSFGQLPPATYFVVGMRPDFTEETAVFKSAAPSAADPAATLDLVMVPLEIYESQKLLHKPVLFWVADQAGQALGNVQLEITWSNGTVLDNVKGETGQDGIAALALLPGRNFVSLRRRGCPKQDDRADVAPGTGVDGFKLIYDCGRK